MSFAYMNAMFEPPTDGSRRSRVDSPPLSAIVRFAICRVAAEPRVGGMACAAVDTGSVTASASAHTPAVPARLIAPES
jgi:hypothetical protein